MHRSCADWIKLLLWQSAPPEEADMPTKAKPKKLPTRDSRVGRAEVKTYRVKSAAKEKPAKVETIRERFVKH